jgi:hypothetical protein
VDMVLDAGPVAVVAVPGHQESASRYFHLNLDLDFVGGLAIDHPASRLGVALTLAFMFTAVSLVFGSLCIFCFVFQLLS